MDASPVPMETEGPAGIQLPLSGRLAAGLEERAELQRRLADSDAQLHYVAQEVYRIESKLSATMEQTQKLQSALDEATQERHCMTMRHNEEIALTEKRIAELEQQQQQQQVSAMPPTSREEHPVEPPVHLSISASIFRGLTKFNLPRKESAAGGGPGGRAAQPLAFGAAADEGHPDTGDQGCFITSEAAAPQPWAQLPAVAPVLQLDPMRLPVEADPEVGFTRSDIKGEVHQFTEALGWACRREDVLLGAASLVERLTRGAMPNDGVSASIPDDAPINAMKPDFLGHALMLWMAEHIWPEPLKYFGFGLPLPAITPAEQNLRALLQSHTARQWLPFVREVRHAVEVACDDTPGWLATLEAHQPDGMEAAAAAAAARAVLEASTKAAAECASWFRSVSADDMAEIVQGSSKDFRVLLLRALELGLFVLAAHPLLQLYVAPLPAMLLRVSSSQHDGTHGATGSGVHVDNVKQLACKRVTFMQQPRCQGSSSSVAESGSAPGGSFVLCSLQPGVQCCTAAAGAETTAAVHEQQRPTTSAGGDASAAAAAEGDKQLVVAKEEVVEWVWGSPPERSGGSGGKHADS